MQWSHKFLLRLLKKGVPFVWDDPSQCSFNSLKVSLILKHLLHLPNYTWDFIFYLASSNSTIGMVLVHEDDLNQEHVFYYLRKGLVTVELHYTYVEKLALARIHVVYFQHLFSCELSLSFLIPIPRNASYGIRYLGENTLSGLLPYKNFTLSLPRKNPIILWYSLRWWTIFLEDMKNLWHKIHYSMSPCFSFPRLALGMEISLSIFKPSIFSLNYQKITIVIFAINRINILLLVMFYIIMV